MGAGARPQFRHLSRDSAHRRALLRHLVEALIEHESIRTTWHKAKEAQRLAEKLITLGKRNTVKSRQSAEAIFFRPGMFLPKLFGPLRERYADRPGGYTRVLRTEPHKIDQAPSAILELVDGERDSRLAMTAKIIARCRQEDKPINDITATNIRKVTRYHDGDKRLDDLVAKFEELHLMQEAEEIKVPMPVKEAVGHESAYRWWMGPEGEETDEEDRPVKMTRDRRAKEKRKLKEKFPSGEGDFKWAETI